MRYFDRNWKTDKQTLRSLSKRIAAREKKETNSDESGIKAEQYASVASCLVSRLPMNQ